MYFFLFMMKIMFKSCQIKSDLRVLTKNKVDTYRAPIFAPDYSATVHTAEMCTNSNEHSMYIRFLWKRFNYSSFICIFGAPISYYSNIIAFDQNINQPLGGKSSFCHQGSMLKKYLGNLPWYLHFQG